MDYKEIIEKLEHEGNDDGLLGRIRSGSFDTSEVPAFLALLQSINFDGQTLVPKRLVALLWYLPSFLAWQRERLEERGVDMTSYERFVVNVTNELESILGVP
jgi:hypothetical protein